MLLSFIESSSFKTKKTFLGDAVYMTLKKAGEIERYSTTLQYIRKEYQDLRERFTKLVMRLGLNWVNIPAIFHEISIGIHDDALRSSVKNQIVEPLEALLKCLERLDRHSLALQRIKDVSEAQENATKQLALSGESLSDKLILAFHGVLLKIRDARKLQQVALELLEQHHSHAKKMARDAHRIHEALIKASHPFGENLSAAEILLQGDCSDAQAEGSITNIEAGLASWNEIFKEFQRISEAHDAITSDVKKLYEEVTGLETDERNYQERLRQWELLFSETEIDPYAVLGEDRRSYDSSNSLILDCRALLNSDLPILPIVRSIGKMPERASRVLEELYEALVKKTPVRLGPKTKPKLVKAEASEDEAVPEEADVPVIQTAKIAHVNARVLAKVIPWQAVVAVYATVCHMHRSKGRTAKIVYQELLIPTGYTFGLTFDEWKIGLEEACVRNLIARIHFKKKFWLYKPTIQRYGMSETLIKHLPEDFCSVLQEALKGLNAKQKLARQAYAAAQKKKKA